jgi:asparagine synthase (glutamine-hydrolysing)
MACVDSFACGRCLHRSLAEDSFDRQPESSDDGRFTLVADVRLDNRDEVCRLVGRAAGECAKLSDSRLLFELLLARGERALDAIIGDFAVAWWDSRERTLRLARDPLGERPLHVARTPYGAMFASMPHALARAVGAELDVHRLACLVADLPAGFRGSFFQGVERVEPGSIVTLTPHGTSARRYWNPLDRPVARYSDPDLGDAMREQIDAAVARRLRRARGAVAAHLSSGFDSSSVATTAAIQLKDAGEVLHAFTSAPLLSSATAPAGRHADESAIAAATAAFHSNIEHHVVRSTDPPLDLGRDHLLAGQPVGSVLNNAWWSQINAQAAQAGAAVMLTGEVGNFTISAGQIWDDLGDLFGHAELGRWWSEGRALARGPGGWRQVLGASLLPLLPGPVANARAALKGARRIERATYVSPAARHRIEAEAARSDWDALSRLRGAHRRLAFLRLADPGAFRKRSLARWGIEERDATADRRLVEFCFSLPIAARLKGGARRPALRHAIEGRVASQVLDTATRGLQSADRTSRISRAELRQFARAVRNPSTETLLDWPAVEAAIALWPAGSGADAGRNYDFSSLLRALSAAHFQALCEGSLD